MTAVVDASIAVKWVLPEPGSERAAALRAADEDLIAPALVCAEIGSAIWRAVIRGDVTAAEARVHLQVAVAHYERLVSLEELADSAMQRATRLRHPIYDCFYLALAEREDCPLITADRRLINAANAIKGLDVRPL